MQAGRRVSHGGSYTLAVICSPFYCSLRLAASQGEKTGNREESCLLPSPPSCYPPPFLHSAFPFSLTLPPTPNAPSASLTRSHVLPPGRRPFPLAVCPSAPTPLPARAPFLLAVNPSAPNPLPSPLSRDAACQSLERASPGGNSFLPPNFCQRSSLRFLSPKARFYVGVVVVVAKNGLKE